MGPPDPPAPSAVGGVSEDAHRFARLARRLARHDDRSTAGQAIALEAVEVIGCTGAAVVHVGARSSLRYEIPGAGPDDLARQMAGIVGRTRQGPAIDAVATGETMHVPDIEHDHRWPDWAAAVVEQTPIRSALVFPLRLDGQDLGVLPLWDEHPGFFTEAVRTVAEVYADHATIALARVEAAEQVHHLRVALDSNRSIATAVGILMSRYRVGDDDAFDILRLASQAANRKLHAIALDVIHEGDLPEALRLERRPG